MPVDHAIAPVPAASYELLQIARHGLARPARAGPPAERYASAHLAALRAAAAVLAARARPGERAGAVPRSAWVLLPEVAPELAEWAAFFAAGAGKRAAAEAGLRRGRSPSARPTTWCATPTGSSPLVEQSLGPGAPAVLPTAAASPSSADRPTAPATGPPRCPTPSSTCTSPPATPCSTAPPIPHALVERAAEHGDGHPRPHRPRRHLRRGQVRQGLPGRRASGRCSASTSPSRRPASLRAPAAPRPAGRGAAHPGARRRVPRRPAACRGCTVPGRAATGAGLGGAVPAGLGDPPGRRARADRSPPSTWSPSTLARGRRRAGAARPGLRARPRRWRRAATTSPARRWRLARGGRPRPTCSSRWSPTGCADGDRARRRRPHAARMAGFARERGLRRGAHQRRPLRRPRRRPDRRRPRRGPPAGRRSTCATSTGPTPRAS